MTAECLRKCRIRGEIEDGNEIAFQSDRITVDYSKTSKPWTSKTFETLILTIMLPNKRYEEKYIGRTSIDIAKSNYLCRARYDFNDIWSGH